MSVTLYADESGIHDRKGKELGAKAVSIAGYLGWSADWEKFCGKWQAVLHRESVPHFHFSDFSNKLNRSSDKTWTYYGWPESRRDKFLFDLADIVKTNTQFSIAGCFSIEKFNKLSPAERMRIGDPYRQCVKKFFESFCEEMSLRWGSYQNERITFVFDNTKNKMWRKPDSRGVFHLQRNQVFRTSTGRNSV